MQRQMTVQSSSVDTEALLLHGKRVANASWTPLAMKWPSPSHRPSLWCQGTKPGTIENNISILQSGAFGKVGQGTEMQEVGDVGRGSWGFNLLQ